MIKIDFDKRIELLFGLQYCVKKDFRGKGYGKKLMNYIIDYAKNNNYKEILLRV